MCVFISHVEVKKGKSEKEYFLTYNQIYNTPRGQMLRDWNKTNDDLIGHGAIRFYYELGKEEGKDRECTDFSKPDNFPQSIIQAIKKGEMRGLGIAKKLLNESVLDDYHAKCKPLDDDYNAKYKFLYDDYKAKCDTLDDDYKAKYKFLCADYNAKYKFPCADYHAKCDTLDDDYKAKCKSLDDDYNAKRNSLFWDLFAIPENRNPAWR